MDMLEKKTKLEKLEEKCKNETNPYKKEQLLNRIRLLTKKCCWESGIIGTLRKNKGVK